MRVYDKPPREEKQDPKVGQTYKGKVHSYQFVDVKTKSGTSAKGLKLWIQAEDTSIRRVSAFDWIGEDETGPFVYKDSKMDSWLCRLFQVNDLSKIKIDGVQDKSCLFTIEASDPTEYTDKKTGKKSIRTWYNVSDIMAVPISTATIQKTTATPPSSQPANLIAPVGSAKPKPTNDDWGDDGDLL